jgi:restriction endonuclease S subunit
MNRKMLMNELEVITCDPDGVNLLRSLILDLALAGQLSTGTIQFEPRLLGDVTSIKTGKLDANASSEDGKYPFFTCAKDPLRISSFSYDTECVLLAGNGNFDVNYYSGKFDAYQRTYILEPRHKDELHVPFLYRFMQSHARRLTEQSIGGVIKYLKIGFLTSAPILVPSFTDQKRIVEIIDEMMKVCDEIELKIKIRDSVRTSVRKSSLDAIATAQSPEELQLAWERIQGNWEVIAGSRESIESLRELILDILFKPKKEDEWQIKSFADLLTISNGDRSKNYPSKEHRVSTGIPFVNAGHLKDGLIDLTDMDYISREKYESLSGGKFNDGDILFCLRGSLGKSALVKDVGEGTVASSLAIFKVGDEIDTEYLFWFLQSGMARIQIKMFDNGTAQPNLAAKSVLKFQIPLPKLPEQKSIVLKVGELMKLCEQLEQKIIQKEDITHKFARSVVSASA